MSRPAIIAVAITGSQPTKADNPAVPISPAEQISSTHEAFEAGASLVHIHVRDRDGRVSSDPALFAEVQDGVRRHCPGMIIQFSTGARGRSHAERGSALSLGPDMASLATGSVNFATHIYENEPALIDELARQMLAHQVKPEIEVFDLAMLYNAEALVRRGLLTRPLHVQFVLGIPGALPARRRVLEFCVAELADLMPDATWTAAGIGRAQVTVSQWALELGGHLRTGLEDNVRIDRDRLAASNAELVERTAALCAAHDAHPATPEVARRILSLPAPPDFGG